MLGFKVDTAGTAREALNKLALAPGGFAAVIVDIGLPDRSGDDLVREIRSMHSSLPIIVATGKGAKDVGEIFQGMKHIAFLGKPYRAEDLYDALRALHVAIPAELEKTRVRRMCRSDHSSRRERHHFGPNKKATTKPGPFFTSWL